RAGVSTRTTGSYRKTAAGSSERGRGDLAGEPRVADDQLAIRAQRLAAALRVQVGEHERRHRLAVHTLRVGVAQCLLDQRLDVVEALVRGPAEQQPAAAGPPDAA